MKNIYTMEQWKQAGTFDAQPGQQIGPDVYTEMLNVLPPLDLPPEKAAQALQDYKTPIHSGFLMGEPHTCDRSGRPLYLAFGMNDYGRGAKYFYIGLSPELEPLDGAYYCFDCMDADVDGLQPADKFKSEADAIQTAADHEATLSRQEYRDGEQISNAILYDPFECFDMGDQLSHGTK